VFGNRTKHRAVEPGLRDVALRHELSHRQKNSGRGPSAVSLTHDPWTPGPFACTHPNIAREAVSRAARAGRYKRSSTVAVCTKRTNGSGKTPRSTVAATASPSTVRTSPSSGSGAGSTGGCVYITRITPA